MEDKELQIAQLTIAQFVVVVMVMGGLIGTEQYGSAIVLAVLVVLYMLELAKMGVEND